MRQDEKKGKELQKSFKKGMTKSHSAKKLNEQKDALGRNQVSSKSLFPVAKTNTKDMMSCTISGAPNQGMKWHLPTKDKKADYDLFMMQMTEKIKKELNYEIKKKYAKDRNNVIKEFVSGTKEEQEQLSPWVHDEPI